MLFVLFGVVIFLVEGVMFDWSVLLVIDVGFVMEVRGGVGYIVFVIVMMIG